MPQPIRQNALDHDLSARIAGTTTVSASPAAAAETVLGTLTIPSFGDLTIVSGVHLRGWAAFTVGTNGVSANMRIRRDTVAGTIIVASGAITETAANLDEVGVQGFDSAPTTGIYALTLIVASGTAITTVSALSLFGIAV